MDASTEDISAKGAPEDADNGECAPSIAWLNLQYEVNSFSRWKNEKKRLLRRLNGHFNWHSLNGLLGPSGAGKTTLLNCLIGNVATHEGSQLYVDGKITNPVSCLVEQHVQEGIAGRLTVRQILQYAYDFKNGRGQGESREDLIRSVLEDMMLDESILSTTFERCSGGEQKRIAIAQELVARKKPSFLCLDEPTTGLDSQAAYVVMSCLKKLVAKYRMTIIASVHVPNDQTLALFDKLYVLAKGGVAVYSGPPERLQTDLESQLARSIEVDEKPIEIAIKMACNGVNDAQVLRLTNYYLAEEYTQVSRHVSCLRPLENGLVRQAKCFSLDDLLTSTQRYSRVTFLAFYRSFLLQLSIYSCLMLLFASIFDHDMTRPDGCQSTDPNSTSTSCSLADKWLLNENIKYHLLSKLLIGNLVGGSSYLSFAMMARNVPGEYGNKWYSMGVSYLSISAVSIIELTVGVFFISSVGYFASEQHTVDGFSINWLRFAHYTCSLWIYLAFLQSAGQLVGVFLMNYIEIGATVAMLASLIFQVLDDFYFLTDELESWLFVQMTELTAVKYTSRYMLYAIYGIGRCNSETQFSAILAKRHVDVDMLIPNLARVLLNTLCFRLLTFFIMYVKYNSFSKGYFCWKRGNNREKKDALPQLIPLQHDEDTTFCKMETKYFWKDKDQFNENLKGKTIFAWQNLTLFSASSIYDLGSSSPSSRPILRSLDGRLTFGSLTALMGMSGAGKTSLLRLLNGQCQTRLDSQTRFFISTLEPIRSCYITQNVSDHLLTGLTVKQLIVYASRLKNLHCPLDHEKVSLRLLEELDLMEASNTSVDKCSGGERKRLALALELTSQRMPNLVCIDEPTSGLDSNSAHKVVSCLRSIAHHHGLAIVTSLHQPSNDLLFLFDQLYVLARGGQCVFSGPPGHIKDHLSTVPGIDLTESKYAIEVLIKHSCSQVDNPLLQTLVQQNSGQLSPDSLLETRTLLDGVPSNRIRFSLSSLLLLCKRYLSSYQSHLWVHPLVFTTIYLLLGIICAYIYDPNISLASGCINLEDDFNSTCALSEEATLDDKRLESNLYYNLFANSNFLSLNILQTGLVLFFEVPLFLNEHRNGWFSSGAFYLMKCLFEIVPALPTVCLYVYLIDIYESVQPGIYWSLLLVYLLSVLAYQAVAHVCVHLFGRNVLILSSLSLVTFILSLLLSNVMVSLGRMHYLFQFLSNFSINRFSIEASLLLQYGFGRCPPGHLQALLYWLNLQDTDYYHCLLMLCVNILFYRCLALYLLVRNANPVEDRRERAARISAHWGSSKGKQNSNQLSLLI